MGLDAEFGETVSEPSLASVRSNWRGLGTFLQL